MSEPLQSSCVQLLIPPCGDAGGVDWPGGLGSGGRALRSGWKASPDDFSALQSGASDGECYSGALSHALPLLSPDSLLPSLGSSRLPLPEAEQMQITNHCASGLGNLQDREPE